MVYVHTSVVPTCNCFLKNSPANAGPTLTIPGDTEPWKVHPMEPTPSQEKPLSDQCTVSKWKTWSRVSLPDQTNSLPSTSISCNPNTSSSCNDNCFQQPPAPASSRIEPGPLAPPDQMSTSALLLPESSELAPLVHSDQRHWDQETEKPDQQHDQRWATSQVSSL